MSATTTKQPAKKSSNTAVVPGKRGSWRRKYFDGIVESYVHQEQIGATGGKSSPGKFAPSVLVQAIQAGLPVKELEDLQESLGVPMETLFPLLGISKATHHRRKASGKLDASVSDRVVRFARLMGKAIEVMESRENARLWLNSPQIGLGGAVPLDFAATEVGAREVENLLGRIEYGVYS